MKTLLVFNHAGGVGKTSLVRDLSYALAQRGKRVLAIDADPQASLTDWLGHDSNAIKPEQSIMHTLAARERALPEPLRQFGFDLIPSCVELSTLDAMLYTQKGIDLRLKHALRSVSDAYDYVLLDSRPSLGGIPYMLSLTATHLIVPVSTTVKALKALRETLELEGLAQENGAPLRLTFFAVTQRHHNLRSDRAALEQIAGLTTLAPVGSPLNYRPAVYARAQEERCPIGHLSGAEAHEAQQDLLTLTQELLSTLEGTES